jgi:hypothetical protein
MGESPFARPYCIVRAIAVIPSFLLFCIVYRKSGRAHVKRCGQIAGKWETPIAVVKADE